MNLGNRSHGISDMAKHKIDDPYLNAAYRWYVISILAMAYAVSYIDRMIISLMVDPIKASFDLSDTQVSLLLGLSFAIFYATSAIPIAWLADRFNRRNIIMAGITVWCLMTSLCGVVKSFPGLFIARMGVGLGEASLAPAGNSLIADAVPKKSLGKAIGFFNAGIAAGLGIAMIAGGYVLSWVGPSKIYTVPVLGELIGWQLTFIAVGLAGLTLAALMLTVREPKRRTDPQQESSNNNATIRETLTYFTDNKRVYLCLYVGYAFAQTAFFGSGAWIPTLFTRVYEWDIASFGLYYGGIIAVVGVAGVLIGGSLCDALYDRGIKSAHWIVTIVSLGFLGLYGFLAIVDNGYIAIALLGFGSFAAFAAAVSAPSAILIMTPNRFRAMATALFFFTINMIGMILGPFLIAQLTDNVFKDPGKLGLSIAVVSISGLICALITLGLGMESYKRRVEAIDSANTNSVAN